ncbi:HK97 gp10 family phage protein [Clostridium sp.]|uniref:HK97 gp10 family phage protein n=1 Tax=Clostridium sp. TaxID=1506 RepID=UPI00290C3EAA|nr:HK97 gp10 family phage protein [Clostridium sp.]MDU7212481.1 HK97 gp10 family phage protein [Clostridium sp.]
MSYKSNIPKIKIQVDEVTESALDEVAITLLANMQSVTPVKTGALKRSLSFKRYKYREHIIKFGSNLIYAPKVEFENKSFLRSTLRGCENEVIDIIKRHLGGIK